MPASDAAPRPPSHARHQQLKRLNVGEALGPVTRHERRLLLAVSLVGVAIAQTGPIPTMRVSAQVRQLFRRKSDTDFGACRTPASLDVGHLSTGGALGD